MRVDDGGLGTGAAARTAAALDGAAAELGVALRLVVEAGGSLGASATDTWRGGAASRAEESRRRTTATLGSLGETMRATEVTLAGLAEHYAGCAARVAAARARLAVVEAALPRAGLPVDDLAHAVALARWRSAVADAQAAVSAAELELEELVGDAARRLRSLEASLDPLLGVGRQLLDVPVYAARSAVATVQGAIDSAVVVAPAVSPLALVAMAIWPRARHAWRRRVLDHLGSLATAATHPVQALGSMVALPELRDRGVGAWAGTLAPTVALSFVTDGASLAARASALPAAEVRTGAHVARVAARGPGSVLERGARTAAAVDAARALRHADTAAARRAASRELATSLQLVLPASSRTLGQRCGSDPRAAAACSPQSAVMRRDARALLFGPEPLRKPMLKPTAPPRRKPTEAPWWPIAAGAVS